MASGLKYLSVTKKYDYAIIDKSQSMTREQGRECNNLASYKYQQIHIKIYMHNCTYTHIHTYMCMNAPVYRYIA